MSFSASVKDELCAVPPASTCCARAELYGALLFAQSWSAERVRVVTTHEPVRRRLSELLRLCLGFDFDGLDPWRIDEPDKLEKLFALFGLERRRGHSIHLNHAVLEDEGCRAALCRGVFLTGGSMTDPLKKYHLELLTPHRHLARELLPILHDCGIEPRETRRGGVYALLLQSSEAIEELLTRIGAPMSTLALMNVKMLKDVRNNVNRQVNCETGNLERTVAASERQIEAIARLRASAQWDELGQPLRQVALARLEHPQASLSELSEQLALGRSALNHRLRRLVAMAEQQLP